jgi:hypothetical protein
MSIALRHAQERVESVLARLAERDLPLMSFESGAAQDAELERVRGLAERHAVRTDRADLLDEAWDRVAAGYASKLGDQSGWVGLVGAPISTPFAAFSAEDRAASQVAIQDLVLAALTEDLLTPEEFATLGAAGEWMLGQGEELPPGWTPPPADVSLLEPAAALRTWPAAELLGAGLLVVLAFLGGWVAMGNPVAGVGLGVGAAVVLVFWRGDEQPPESEES